MKSQFILRMISHLSEKAFWNRAAGSYSKYIRIRFEESDPVYQDILVPKLLATIKSFKPKSVLDIGCGDGWFTNLLAAFCKNVTGVDYSAKMISLAAKTYPRCRFLCQDAAKAPLSLSDGKKFDVIAMNMSLQDISNPEKVVKNACKVLSNDGFVVISIPHPAFFNKLTSGFFEGTKNTFDFRKYLYRSEHVFFKKMAGGKKVFHYHRSLDYYFNLLFKNNFEFVSYDEIFSSKSRRFNEIPFAIVLTAAYKGK